MKSLVLIVTSLLFISCSNVTVGFEEDSPFYNGPLIDTREDANGEKVTPTQNSIASDESTKNTVVKSAPKEQKSEEETIEVPKDATSQESETTFSYERDDD